MAANDLLVSYLMIRHFLVEQCSVFYPTMVFQKTTTAKMNCSASIVFAQSKALDSVELVALENSVRRFQIRLNYLHLNQVFEHSASFALSTDTNCCRAVVTMDLLLV